MAKKTKKKTDTDIMIQITMTRAQAEACARACELYLRERMGQFGELSRDIAFNGNVWSSNQQEALECRMIHGLFENVYRTIVSDHEGIPDHERGFRAESVFTAIRHALAYHDHPEGGHTVDFFSPPFNRSDCPTPTVEVITDRE